MFEHAEELDPASIKPLVNPISTRITKVKHIPNDDVSQQFDVYIGTDGTPDVNSKKEDVVLRIPFKNKKWLSPQRRMRAVTMFRLFCSMLKKSSEKTLGETGLKLNEGLFDFLNVLTPVSDGAPSNAFCETVAYNILCDETQVQEYVRMVFKNMKRFFDVDSGSVRHPSEANARNKIKSFLTQYCTKHSVEDKLQYYANFDPKEIESNTKSANDKFCNMIRHYIDALMTAAFVKEDGVNGYSWFGTSAVCPLVFAMTLQSESMELFVPDGSKILCNIASASLNSYIKSLQISDSTKREMAAATAQGWSEWFVAMGKRVTIGSFSILKNVAINHWGKALGVVIVGGAATSVLGSIPFVGTIMVSRIYSPLYMGLDQLVTFTIHCLGAPSTAILSIMTLPGAAIHSLAAYMGLVPIGEGAALTVNLGLLYDFHLYLKDQPTYVLENVYAYLSYAIATIRSLRHGRRVPTVVFKGPKRRFHRLEKQGIVPRNLPPAQTQRKKASSSSDMDVDETSDSQPSQKSLVSELYDDDTGGPSVPDETGEGDVAVWSDALQPGAASQ